MTKSQVRGEVLQPEKQEFTGNLGEDVPSGWWGHLGGTVQSG